MAILHPLVLVCASIILGLVLTIRNVRYQIDLGSVEEKNHSFFWIKSQRGNIFNLVFLGVCFLTPLELYVRWKLQAVEMEYMKFLGFFILLCILQALVSALNGFITKSNRVGQVGLWTISIVLAIAGIMGAYLLVVAT